LAAAGHLMERSARPERSERERLLSLDVFRGLTVAGMLLVNHPGSWSAIYPPLAHATWHGWTPTDLIFPFFVFIVGITTQISINARRERGDDEGSIVRQILKRGALIFLFGLLVNGFPFFTWGAVADNPEPSFFDRVVDRLYHWRIFGVLQRIGVAYIVSALIATRVQLRTQVVITAAILVGYWLVMTALPVPGSNGTPGRMLLDRPESTMAAWWDRVFLDWTRFGLGNHIWSGSRTWDPEGILSTAGAIGTALLGNIAGWWLARKRALPERLNGLFAGGALLMMGGLMWNWVFPINKGIWTSSYVLFTAGLAALSIGTIMWLADVQQWRRWTKPFVIYGTNPMVAFVGSGVLARCIYTLFRVEYNGQTMPIQGAIYQSMYASWLSPVNASLAFALSFVLLFFFVLAHLHRKNIVFKV
jgi:predicted acyltransferase